MIMLFGAILAILFFYVLLKKKAGMFYCPSVARAFRPDKTYKIFRYFYVKHCWTLRN